MRKYIYYFSLILIVGSTASNAQSKEEDVVLRALQDEMERNMKELKVPEYEKPFFMLFGVKEVKTSTVAATLGSLTNSVYKLNRFKTNTRILVGDYDFNDESLEDNLYSQPTAIEIELPVDNDYWGIRRAFWSTVDKVYRDAARHFDNHKKTLKEFGKKLEEVPHRSFAKGKPVRMVSSLTPYQYDKQVWEDKVRRLSALFLKSANIQNSVVVVQYNEGYQYLVSSEGTVARLPFQRASFITFCQTKSEEGEFDFDQITYEVSSLEKLPDEEKLAAEIEAMVKRMETKSENSKFEDEYTGPVLLMGSAVVDLFQATLFNGKESIVANDNIAKLTGYQYNNERNNADAKIGKVIFNELITIKAKPTLKTYNGVELFGSYAMDDEAMVPADELVVVEKGVLKQLLNNRTITHPSQVANGFSSGPGVLEIVLNLQDSEKALKEKLISQAKKDGLEYALIVREENRGGNSSRNIYKVYVQDVREELIRNANVNLHDSKLLRKIMGATATYTAHNAGGSMADEENGQSISYIVPTAVLLEEADAASFPMPTLKEEQYVSSPLVKK